MQVTDQWLDRWIPLMQSAAADDRILELGCGPGRDTAVLVDAGFHVIGLDISEENLRELRRILPGTTTVKHDIREPLPFTDNQFPIILASLSLHYFPWQKTLEVVAEIDRCLKPRGIFICRLNSSNDHCWGASGHPPVSKNFYSVNGEPKRFFDEEAVDSLFESWESVSEEEVTIDRYSQPKTVWELVLMKPPKPHSVRP